MIKNIESSKYSFCDLITIIDQRLVDLALSTSRYFQMGLVADPDDHGNSICFSSEKCLEAIIENRYEVQSLAVTQLRKKKIVKSKITAEVMVKDIVYFLKFVIGVALDSQPLKILFDGVSDAFSNLVITQDRKWIFFHEEKGRSTSYQYNVSFASWPKQINGEKGLVLLSCAIGIKTIVDKSKIELLNVTFKSKSDYTCVLDVIVTTQPVKEEMSTSEMASYNRQVSFVTARSNEYRSSFKEACL